MTAFASVSIGKNEFAAYAATFGNDTDTFLDTFCAAVVTQARSYMIPGVYLYRTGTLYKSFEILPGPTPHSRVIHVAAPYAGVLELGGTGRAAKPFLLPAIMLLAPSVAATWKATIS